MLEGTAARPTQRRRRNGVIWNGPSSSTSMLGAAFFLMTMLGPWAGCWAGAVPRPRPPRCLPPRRIPVLVREAADGAGGVAVTAVLATGSDSGGTGYSGGG